MKVAIIGATSFVGENLILHLQKSNLNIIATYNTNKKVKNKRKIIWKKLDLRKRKKNYFKYLGSPDIVINLAWPDIPNYKTKKHFQSYRFQKKLNYNLIYNGLKNLIVTGTCYEYGKVSGKISENLKAKPTIPYAKAKLKLLENLLKLQKQYSFKLCWLRPFFVYGYNKKRRTLFNLIKDFDKKKLDNLKVCGELKRDFVPINFLCKSIIKVAKLNSDIGVLNICTGKPQKLKKFIKENINNYSRFKKIIMNGKNPNNFEAKEFWGDNRKLNNILFNNKK